jgi:hypothetical protein
VKQDRLTGSVNLQRPPAADSWHRPSPTTLLVLRTKYEYRSRFLEQVISIDMSVNEFRRKRWGCVTRRNSPATQGMRRMHRRSSGMATTFRLARDEYSAAHASKNKTSPHSRKTMSTKLPSIKTCLQTRAIGAVVPGQSDEIMSADPDSANFLRQSIAFVVLCTKSEIQTRDDVPTIRVQSAAR